MWTLSTMFKSSPSLTKLSLEIKYLQGSILKQKRLFLVFISSSYLSDEIYLEKLGCKKTEEPSVVNTLNCVVMLEQPKRTCVDRL